MENISHSLPKRSFSSNSNAAFTSHKSVYDDVFGGPPKFGLPTLAPRLEDYSEIFGGFHASRSSSIPLLHLPLIGDDSHQRFDVPTPCFDYSEVFGDFGGFAFTASFEDLIGHSSGGYDSSDDPWSPAQSGSLSDELDPLAGSDKSHRLSDGDVHQSESINQLNISYNKSSQRNMATVLTESSHVTNFSAIPGYTSSHYGSPASWKGEDEHCSVHVNDDLNNSKEFVGRVTEEKYCKGLSNPLPNDFNTHGNDFNPLGKHVNSTSVRDKPFVTVSDISLRTKPSRLPPPSRPPPALVVKNGECERSNSKLKASKSYAFDRVADDSTSFFDVEVDAATSVGDRENGSRNVEVKHGSTKESIDRKDTWDHSVMQLGEQINKTIRVSSNSEDEKMVQSRGKETAVSAHVLEDRIGSRKGTEKTSRSQDLEYHDHMAGNFSGVVAWREAKEYFEVIEENISRQAFDTVEGCDTLMQHVNQNNYGHQMTTYYGAFNKKGDDKKFEETKEDPERNQPEMKGEHCDWGIMLQKEKPNGRLSNQMEFEEKVILNKLACICDLDMVIPENFQLLGEREMLNGNMSAVEDKQKLRASHKAMDIEKSFVDPQLTKQNSGKHKQNILGEECQRRLEEVEGAEPTYIVKERTEAEEIEKQTGGTSGIRNENKLKQTHELKEKWMILKEAKKHGESGQNSYIDAGHEKGGVEQLSSEVDEDKERLSEAGKKRVNELTFNEALEQVGKDKENKLIYEREEIKERNGDASRTEENDLRFRMAEAEAGDSGEAFARRDTMGLSRDGLLEELSRHAEEIEPIDRTVHEAEVKWDMDDHVLIKEVQLNVFDGECKHDEAIASKVSWKHDNIEMPEVAQAEFSAEGNSQLKTEPNSIIYDTQAGVCDSLLKGKLNRFSKSKDELQDGRTCNATNNSVESPSLPKQMIGSNICGRGMGVSCVMPEKPSSVLELEPGKIMSTEDDEGQKVKEIQFISKRVDIRDSFIPCQVIRESLVNGRKVEDASSPADQSDDTLCSMNNATCLRDKNFKENLATRNQKVGDRIRRQTELENERMRKMEEEREREREREKDRMAVDKAALEAREKSYADARERAERAAVERATAEVRQRAMAGARERLERASMEARLRADRAAVDRATAEAWQRAAEKSMAEKTASYVHDRVERSVPDRFSASFRSVDTRQTSLSSDLHFQSTGISNVLRDSYSSVHVGADGESTQRCKARLERYRRTAERAANALAEKNRRDLLAQREREERNRVAEALDAEVKRWSNGKEGNLRALLSTLQYILGPDSGWQPVPLTEVITSAAVKRAYRKATLCVHPDKLQQRGATIQQKYICEKVFDLLKEAWNKFNSEEH
ncbi:Auxilin-like protein 1 [Sesamum alatum]|uniref:Auxilin-like protein 1 n=1 Tax=Sesamum alatum TaxID=300844 RepID=A0AAE1YI20_9LAMI|nr:Auxilin-like protein 1 [Sesamum alatum]